MIGPAHAVPYALPSDGGVNQAQLQTVTDYRTVCDTAVSPACDVPPGAYQLVVYRQSWSDISRRRVQVVDRASSPSALTFVTDSNTTRLPVLGNTPGATAQCPVGSRVIGVITCVSTWHERDFPDDIEQAATAIESDDATARCYHLVGPNDPYRTAELRTTLKAVCSSD